MPIRARFVIRREAREKGRKFSVVQSLHGLPGFIFIYCSTRSYLRTFTSSSFVVIHESDIHLDNSKSNLILESKDTEKSHQLAVIHQVRVNVYFEVIIVRRCSSLALFTHLNVHGKGFRDLCIRKSVNISRMWIIRLDTGCESWHNSNSLSIRVSGIMEAEDGKHRSYCNPHSIFCEPTTFQDHM